MLIVDTRIGPAQNLFLTRNEIYEHDRIKMGILAVSDKPLSVSRRNAVAESDDAMSRIFAKAGTIQILRTNGNGQPAWYGFSEKEKPFSIGRPGRMRKPKTIRHGQYPRMLAGFHIDRPGMRSFFHGKGHVVLGVRSLGKRDDIGINGTDLRMTKCRFAHDLFKLFCSQIDPI